MDVYESDEARLVAGVCAEEAMRPPEISTFKPSYELNRRDELAKKMGRLFHLVISRMGPDPFQRIGRRKTRILRKPPFLSKERHVLVEFMTGFRMSFRSEIIRRVRFCETFEQYCLFEDTDASFSALDYGVLVGAKGAQIYHHKYPAKRADGFEYGAIQILNRAYVVSKHSRGRPEEILCTWLHVSLQLLRYIFAAQTNFGFERLRGAYFGTRHVSQLLATRCDRKRDGIYNTAMNIVRLRNSCKYPLI